MGPSNGDLIALLFALRWIHCHRIVAVDHELEHQAGVHILRLIRGDIEG